MKRILPFLFALVLIFSSFSLASCAKDKTGASTGEEKNADGFEKTEEESNFVCIEVEKYGKIILELYPEKAPITVENFKKLVKNSFYDGLIFHRVIKGFMIQGGDPTGTGFYGSGEEIKGEFSANSVQNDLLHTRGVVSMARGNAPDSASSQFFIVHQDSPHLNGQYAAFGKVVSGMDVVDKIASVKTNSNDKPLENVTMKAVYFVTEK